MRLHAAGDIHRVAPHVIYEFAASNHTRNHCTGIDSKSKTYSLATAKGMQGNILAHFNSHADQRLRMIAATARYAGGHHVAVANRTDLFDIVFIKQGVEKREYLVKQFDYLRRSQ